MKELTKVDRGVLEKCPDGWFDIDRMPLIKNAFHRLQRLADRGLLEWRVVGPVECLRREWKRTDAGRER